MGRAWIVLAAGLAACSPVKDEQERQKDIGLLDYECTAMLDELGIHHTWPRDFDVVK